MLFCIISEFKFILFCFFFVLVGTMEAKCMYLIMYVIFSFTSDVFFVINVTYKDLSVLAKERCSNLP